MIRVICVGKVKERYLVEATKEYEKRIKRFHKLEIIQVMDSNISDEGKLIMRHIRDRDYVITLEIDGEEMESVEFAKMVDDLFMVNSDITFVIGGSDGISDEVKRRSNYRLSFSRMTFPHQLFRVMLLEQIYRCFKILNNQTYHK